MDYQDALAVLGVGSAHPGGWASSLQWMDEIPWHPSMSVLDVGCGTGRTLLHVQRATGCNVCGVDVRPKMIEKAIQRAAAANVDAAFLVADAEQLPFPDSKFDVVYTESVNVFVRIRRALSEYHRVLKPGGWYVDVEMLALGPVGEEWKESVRKVYGAKMVPDQKGWKQLYREAGFTEIRTLTTRQVLPGEMLAIEHQYPDDQKLADAKAYSNPQLLKIMQANSEWFDLHYKSLGYGIFAMRKPGVEA
jgi:ubiquinone/menaquinone biosynthesis C-methylase UbiE